jgi:hypothetical protein
VGREAFNAIDTCIDTCIDKAAGWKFMHWSFATL